MDPFWTIWVLICVIFGFVIILFGEFDWCIRLLGFLAAMWLAWQYAKIASE